MKKTVSLFLFTLLAITALGAQDLTPIGDDIAVMFKEIGKDILPHMQQGSLTGDGLGSASMGAGKFFVSHSTGAVLSDGILAFIEPSNSYFSALNVYGLVDTVVSGSTTLDSLYSKAKEFFPYPNFRLAVGFKPLLGIETIITFSMLPQFLTGWITGLTGVAELEQLELSTMNAGLKLRRALLEGSGPFPTISIAAGYTYSRFHFAFEFPSSFTQDYSGLILTLGGSPNFDFVLHTAGAEVAVSRRMGFIEPYFRAAAWYQWASYEAAIDGFIAELRDSFDVLITSAAAQGIDPTAELSINDLSVLLSAGLEMGRKWFRLVPGCSYDLATSTFAASLVFRAQF